MIICLDDQKYWRKEIFPYYKGKRAVDRQESKIDWDGIFEVSNTVREALKNTFAFRAIQVPTVEADDIIATLVHEIAAPSGEKTVIVASDKDFYQLLKYPNVSILGPDKKKFLTQMPQDELVNKIIKGDSGDGIPNIKSDDDTFMNPDKRQKGITEKFIAEIKERLANNDLGPYERNYKRNESLISLEKIPQKYREQIIEAYEAQADKKANGVMEYLASNKLRMLLDCLQDFQPNKKAPAGIGGFFG
jgi:5'-3' exonuclease